MKKHRVALVLGVAAALFAPALALPASRHLQKQILLLLRMTHMIGFIASHFLELGIPIGLQKTTLPQCI